jgi:predicted transposase YdaD
MERKLTPKWSRRLVIHQEGEEKGREERGEEKGREEEREGHLGQQIFEKVRLFSNTTHFLC